MTVHAPGAGGRRSGAGRKVGSKNKNKAILDALAKKAIEDGSVKTPLEIMLFVMQQLMDEADANKKPTERHRRRMLAVDVASKAAPYVHARLATVDANVSGKIGVYEASLMDLAGDDSGV